MDRTVHALFNAVLGSFDALEIRISKLEKQMAATKTDLDSAISDLSAAYTTLKNDVTTGLATLEAKIAAGATPEDLQAEVDSIRALVGEVKADDAQVLAAGGATAQASA